MDRLNRKLHRRDVGSQGSKSQQLFPDALDVSTSVRSRRDHNSRINPKLTLTRSANAQGCERNRIFISTSRSELDRRIRSTRTARMTRVRRVRNPLERRCEDREEFRDCHKSREEVPEDRKQMRARVFTSSQNPEYESKTQIKTREEWKARNKHPREGGEGWR